MILSSDKNNINNAYTNQKKYNNLSEENKKKWIYGIYNFYNNSIPLVLYSKKNIDYSFNILCKAQKYSIITDCEDYAQFKKYGLNNLINFIKNNSIKINNNKKIEKFLNCILTIVDEDYKKNYVNISTLSDFYQNKERIECKVIKNLTPYEYYKKNYNFILDKYFKNLGIHYEKGLLINKLSFENNDEEYNNAINPLYLQSMMYENNKFCTVYKPYLFKLFISIFKGNNKPKILDLS